MNTLKEAVFNGKHKCLNGVEVPVGMIHYIYDYISKYSDMALFDDMEVFDADSQEVYDVSLLNEFLNEFYYRVVESEE